MIDHIVDPRLRKANSETSKRSLAVSVGGNGIAGEYTELTVWVLPSLYVKVEAKAAEEKRSPESTAAFLLSQWVATTPAGAAKRSLAVRAGASVRRGGA